MHRVAWALQSAKGTGKKCEKPWENHGFTSGEDRNRTFGCFRCVFEEFERCPTDVLGQGYTDLTPQNLWMRDWNLPLRHRFHPPDGLMTELQVLASAFARLFGLNPFGGDAVPHRYDERRFPAWRQVDVESHEFPG
jgi:hypothetical protein